MEKVVNNFGTLDWWVSVVFAGIVVSVLGAYAKTWAERAVSSVSSSIRAKLVRNNADRVARVSLLRSDKQEQILALGESNHLRLRALVFLIMSTLCVLLVVEYGGHDMNKYLEFALRIFAVLPLFWGLGDILRAQHLKALIDEARA